MSPIAPHLGALRLASLAVSCTWLCLAGTASTVSLSAQAGARPNVVLVIADDLGYGDLSSYGAPDIKTPHLDRLARDGVRLTSFYANAPVCTPTRAALITGRYQQRVLLERPLRPNVSEGLPVTGRSLPQLLKNHGYATGLVGKWHLGRQEAVRPLRHGFDSFWGYLAGYIDWYTHTNSEGEADLWQNAAPVTHAGYFGHEVTGRAVAFIGDHARQPFFLEVAYGAPHWPYQSPHRASTARDKAKHLRASDEDHPTREDYVAIVEDADAGVGQILSAIDRHGLTDNTLVVFMSDNGGEWLSRNAPFFHRKDSLWEGGIRVPAIFRWPSVLPAGATSDQVGITMDVTATILAATATPVPPETRLEGRDLVPILSGKTAVVERTLYLAQYASGPDPASGSPRRLEAPPRRRERVPVQPPRRSRRAQRPRHASLRASAGDAGTERRVGEGRGRRSEVPHPDRARPAAVSGGSGAQNTSVRWAHCTQSASSSSELRCECSASSVSATPRASMPLPHTPISPPCRPTFRNITSRLS